jgi:deazaflavin-dependent oxidoreductase (nitroreductase family)
VTRAPRLHAIRPFTMRVVNPITRRFAGRLPGFGLLTHVGRTSGRAYTTPINVFRRGTHHLFALTYGSDVQWVKNVLAAGGCTLRTRGRTLRLVDPELITDPSLRLMPLPVRLFLRPMHVTEVLRLREADQPAT